ncbi:MAG: magnesium transporter [Anaerolineae bacterium]|nr:magnesium transporter [Anaerolineae bacterium]
MNIQDMTRDEWVDHLYDRIHKLLDDGFIRQAQIILEALLPADQAEIFSDLSIVERRQVLMGLPLEDIADILEKLEDEEVAEIASLLPPEQLADILDEMEPDEAADLLGDLTPTDAAQILDLMEDREEIRPLLLHPDETAGGLMTSEYMALGRQMWARNALDAIRDWSPEHEYLYYFVVDKNGTLLGTVSLLQLIKAEPKTEIQDFMDRNVVSAPLSADQEECAKLMSRYDLTALPVIDDDKLLVGVITIDDIVDVLEDEATEDIQRLGGSAPLDKPYLLTSAWEVTRRRIVWLLVLFVTSMLTSNVLAFFEDTLDKVVALAFFIPMLIGTGGNAGSQTTATVIRALGVGEVEKKDTLKVLWHEIQSGLLLGVLVGIAGFFRVFVFEGDLALGLTVGAALAMIVLCSNSVGSLLPVFASLIGVDPALISGPLMSTLVDATGLFIYLSVAKWILGV